MRFRARSAHLIERDLIVSSIIELGCARTLVRSHLLGAFEQPTVEQIDGDTRGFLTRKLCTKLAVYEIGDLRFALWKIV